MINGRNYGHNVKVSIIVPVYKAEDYIKRCVNSILSQTYSNFELILVDDGSPDDSGTICEQYASKDDRILVLHQKNAGQSLARNNAIKNATGDYFMFVDADDAIPSYTVESLLYYAIRDSAEVTIGNYEVFTEELPTENFIKVDLSGNESKCCAGHEVIRYMHTVPGEKYVVMWGKLFSRKLFDGIEFPVGRICEDLAVLYKLYDKSRKISIVDISVYWYFRGNDNSSTFELKDNFYSDVYLALEEEIAYMKAYRPEYTHFPQKTYLFWLMDEYRKLFKLKRDKKKRSQLYRKYCMVYCECDSLPNEKFYRFFKFMPRLYCLIKKY